MNLGTLWGIGVGPGDGEWLTLKGLRIIQSVDIIAVPQNNQGQPGMAYKIVRDFLSAEQTILPLYLPFVRDKDHLEQAWQKAASQLVPYLKAGRDVAFLSEGDISFYSTFTYIFQTLKSQLPDAKIDSVPGICSPLAAASVLQEPLAIGSEKIAILPAIYSLQELENALQWAEVVVLMKVGSVFTDVWYFLQEKGLLERAQLVEWIGWDKQKIYATLKEIEPTAKPHYFSILILRKQDSA